MMRAIKCNTDASKCVVSVFIICLFHLVLISGSYASDSDIVANASASDSNSEQAVQVSQGSANLTSRSPQDISFIEGVSNLSSTAYLSKPAELTILTACVAVGLGGAILGGLKYTICSYLPFQDFDWYEFAAACILGAATAIAILILTAFGPTVVAAVFGYAAADEAGLTSVVESWIAGKLRSAVSGITEITSNFPNLKNAIESVDANLEDSMRDFVQALVDASSGEYQEPDFDSRWIDFSTASPELYGVTYSVDAAEYNSAFETSWRLLTPGVSRITLNFDFSKAPSNATLLLTHLSSAEATCPGGGYSPVDIYINGHLLEDNYDVAEQHCGFHGFKTDRWNLSGHLLTQNTVVIELEDDPWACSHYWIQNITIFPGTPSEDDETTFFVSPYSGDNGSIEPNDLVWASECDDIVFTATPDDGYKVQSWFFDGLVYQVGGTVFEIADIQASHSISVTFEPIDPARSITVVSPNGGELYEYQGSLNISWDSDGGIGQYVKIEVLDNGVPIETMEEEPNIGYKEYDMGSSIQVGTDYQIKVSSVSYPSIYDISDASFEVVDEMPPLPDTLIVSNYDSLVLIGSDGQHPNNGIYLLTNNIDANGESFYPLLLFDGVLEGQGYAIQDLEYENMAVNLVGLFSTIDDSGIVRNLIIESPDFRGNQYVGAIAGRNEGLIANCKVISPQGSEVRGNNYVGGITGENYGTIKSCVVEQTNSELSVWAELSAAGGIVGYNHGASAIILDCVADCGITGKDDYTGGVAGRNGATIRRCCYIGPHINGNDWGNGGVVGWNEGGTVQECYYNGSALSGEIFNGGIVGWFEGGLIEDCYAAGPITFSPKGGLVGRCGGIIRNSFWDTQVTVCSEAFVDGSCTIDNSHGETTVEMMKQATYTTKYGTNWDFTNTWAIHEDYDYPRLRGNGDRLLPPSNTTASQDLSSGVQVSWSHSTYEISDSTHNAVYRVYRSESADIGALKTELTSEWRVESAFHDNNASYGVTYYYWIKAAAGCFGSRESEFSDVASGQRIFSPLDAPAAVSASEGLPLTVLVEWDAVANANYYRVYRSLASDVVKTVLGNWDSELSYIDYPPYPDTTYSYWVIAAVDNAGGRASNYGGPDDGYCVDPPTDVGEDDQQLLPQVFSVSQNYPNPFNPTTNIVFELPRRSHVMLTIYNVLGQTVNILVNREMSAGYYTVDWDGRRSNGSHVATGVYLYQLVADDYIDTKTMILLK